MNSRGSTSTESSSDLDSSSDSESDSDMDPVRDAVSSKAAVIEEVPAPMEVDLELAEPTRETNEVSSTFYLYE